MADWYGFMVFIRNGQANKQIPPVVNQRDHTRHDLAGLQLPSDKTAPTPLVFCFIKVVLTVGSVTIVLLCMNYVVEFTGACFWHVFMRFFP